MKMTNSSMIFSDYSTNYGTSYHPAYDFGFIFIDDEETEQEQEFEVIPPLPNSSGIA